MDEELSNLRLSQDNYNVNNTTPTKEDILEEEKGNSSDDDLLSPPLFLYQARAYHNIRTPEKAYTPIHDNLSPVTPEHHEAKTRKTTHRFSLTKLLNDKTKWKEDDKMLTEIDEGLKDKIDQGGILSFADKVINESSQDLNDSQTTNDDDSQTQVDERDLPPEFQKIVQSMKNDFADGYPGEKVFIETSEASDVSPPADLQTFLCDNDDSSDESDQSGQNSDKSFDLDMCAREILLGGFLIDIAILKDIPQSIMNWLLDCMCHSEEPIIVEAACRSYWAIVVAKRQSGTANSILPSVRRILTLLQEIGASTNTLFPSTELLRHFSSFCETLNDTNQAKSVSDAESSSETTNNYLPLRIQALVKSYSCCLQQCPQSYSLEDITCTIVVSCRICLDIRLYEASWDVQVLIGCALDCYSETQWIEEIPLLCQLLPKITERHRNMLQLAEIIPMTDRGNVLKRILASTLAARILNHPFKNSDIRQHIKNPVVGIALRLLLKIAHNENTDYYQLFSLLSLVNLALPSDDIKPSEKSNLEKVITKLRSLNGEIRDPGGAFMNRTKVKDSIVRMISRLMFVSRGLQTQCHLDNLFEETQNMKFSDLKIEKLESKNITNETDSDAGSIQEDELTDAVEHKCRSDDSSSSRSDSSDNENTESIENSENPLSGLGLGRSG